MLSNEILSMPKPTWKAAAVRYGHYSRVGEVHWPYPHFTPREMADPITNELIVVPAFMDWLETVRNAYGKPMVIAAGYRTADMQELLTERRTGAHVDGMAVDVMISGEDAYIMSKIAFEYGALGVGLHQTGPHEHRYLHLDRWTKAPDGLRPRVWSD